jgi:NDP-sugar pyrophosphorylase family protein
MKAILLAGGKGTRLRPLTLHTPKPIVPIFDRPFLRYQIDLVRQVPEIDEIVLSLNYQPGRIQEVFGDGTDLGIRIRYVVEPQPLGTGGAIKFAAGESVKEPVVVFNGDVLTSVDLPALLKLHRDRKAKATITLTPVENPTAYGLVETDKDKNIKAFIEKPKEDEITTNLINAGIYVLEPETFVAYEYRGYWIDIGTPEKYLQVHRDIMEGRFAAPPFSGQAGKVIVSPNAKIDASAVLEGPCFIDSQVVVKAGARIGAGSVIGRGCHIEENAVIDGAILWPNTWVDTEAVVTGAIVGRHAHIGRNATVSAGAMLGDKTVLTDFTRS